MFILHKYFEQVKSLVCVHTWPMKVIVTLILINASLSSQRYQRMEVMIKAKMLKEILLTSHQVKVLHLFLHLTMV